jgi:hypothetical protein
MLKKWVMLILVLGVVSACATVPTGPSVMVMPGAGKPFDQFQLDDMVCRQYAQQQIGMAPEQAATESAVNTAVLGTAIGAAVGAGAGFSQAQSLGPRPEQFPLGPFRSATTSPMCNACTLRGIRCLGSRRLPHPARRRHLCRQAHLDTERTVHGLQRLDGQGCRAGLGRGAWTACQDADTCRIVSSPSYLSASPSESLRLSLFQITDRFTRISPGHRRVHPEMEQDLLG